MTWIVLLRRFWKPLACVAAVLLAWLALHHYGATRFSAGYQQAVGENAKALDDWQIKYDAQVAADEHRITSAHHSHELELAQLAGARAHPVTHVVCRRTSSGASDVPTTAGVPAAEAASAGALSPETEGSAEPFDPTDQLIALADEADYMLASCRELQQAVHGAPSGP